MTPDVAPNGWNEWSKYVLKELERLGNCYEDLRDDVQDLKTNWAEERIQVHSDITGLKVRASMWGAGAGALLAAAIGVAGKFLVP